MSDNTFTRVDPLMMHDALLYGPHRQDAADYACAALRAAYAEIDRLTKRLAIRDSVAQDYVRAMELMSDDMDRLRASSLEWVTVTNDPATLPAVGRRVIVEHRNSGMTFAAQIDGPDLWALGSFDGERDTYAILSPGDRWAYIPEAQA